MPAECNIKNSTMRVRKRRLAILFLSLPLIAIIIININVSSINFRKEARKGKDSSAEWVLRKLFQPAELVIADCPIPKLATRTANNYRYFTTKQPVCQRLKPITGSCEVANNLFKGKNLPGCGKVQTDICKVRGNRKLYTVACNTSSCEGVVTLGTIAMETGAVSWSEPKDSGTLENSIVKLMSAANAGYCMIKCVSEKIPDTDYQYFYQEDTYHDTQILTIPPLFQYTQVPLSKSSSKQYINFNLIFIDSVSRHHFYRSMPETIKYFNTVSHSTSNSVILDYELVQGIRSRTFESLQALFSGYVNPFEKPFSTLSMPPSALKTETLLNLLKAKGYNTLWLEDLCYLWEWGISKDLLVHNKSLDPSETWKKLQLSLAQANIDSLGNTHVNCQILKENNVNDHFHGPRDVCFNGRHQHQYSLEYLKFYQDVMFNSGNPYFTFYETNIGHEDTGLRIQYLDADLVDYLRNLQSQQNTMTIIFSDHGNAYGHFIDKSQEGRVELFHPFIFMIIPKTVQWQLGGDAMKTLYINQGRLVSLLDMHYMLKSFAASTTTFQQGHISVPEFNKQFNVSEMGLLSEISHQRTCDDMPRIMPNLCICEGYEEIVVNTSYHYVLALFALGEINNEIQTQYYRSTRKGGFGNCQRLKLSEVTNVRESINTHNIRTVKMDLVVDFLSSNRSEIFFVAVDVPIQQGKYLQLSRFERITPYSPFSQCSDAGVELQLCVCSEDNENWKRNGQIPMNHVKYPQLSIREAAVDHKGSKCILFVSQNSDKGFILEAVNFCSVSVNVAISMTTSHLIMSRSPDDMIMTLNPGDVTFVTAGVEESVNVKWTWEMSVMAN